MICYKCNILTFVKERVKKMKNKNFKTAEKLLPPSYRPLSPWNYFWRSVLYSIPVIGWIFMLVHAFASKSRHGRSFAGAYIFLTLLALAGILGAGFYFGFPVI